jgi:hypothetical protein
VTGYPKNLKSAAIVNWLAPVDFEHTKLQHAIIRKEACRNSEDNNINMSVKSLQSGPRPRNPVKSTGGCTFGPVDFTQIHNGVVNHDIHLFFARFGQKQEKLDCYALRANRNVNNFSEIHTCAVQV